MIKKISFIIFFIILFQIILLSKVIVPATETLYPFIENGKWGFIDNAGNIVIKAQYKEVGEFSQRIAPVKMFDNSWIYIDKFNKNIFGKSFQAAHEFKNSVAAVINKGCSEYSFIDLNGNFLKNCLYYTVREFSEGLIGVNKEGIGWTFLNSDLEKVFDLSYFYAGRMSNSLLAVFDERDYTYKYIDIKKREVLSFEINKVNAISDFHDGLACASINGKWGYINKAGIFVIKPQFDVAFPFYEDLASVKLGGKWGYIKKDGTFHIRPECMDSKYIYAGYYLYFNKENPKNAGGLNFFGFDINRDKKEYMPLIISPHKKAIFLRYSEGLSIWNVKTRNGNKFGYIDRAGNLVIKARYDMAWPFKEGIARVKIDDKFGYINKKGKWVLKPRI